MGDLCSPCHSYITRGLGVHSQAYRNGGARLLDYLEGLVAAHEGGATVMLSYDDATFDHTLSVGYLKPKLLAAGKGFKHTIELAMSGRKYDED